MNENSNSRLGRASAVRYLSRYMSVVALSSPKLVSLIPSSYFNPQKVVANNKGFQNLRKFIGKLFQFAR